MFYLFAFRTFKQFAIRQFFLLEMNHARDTALAGAVPSGVLFALVNCLLIIIGVLLSKLKSKWMLTL